MTPLLALALALLLPLWGLLQPAWVLAASDPAPQHYRCEGDPLLAEVHAGAVDAPGIPNATGGTVPGAFLEFVEADAPGAITAAHATAPDGPVDANRIYLEVELS